MLAYRKSLAEFAPSGAKKFKSVFGRDMCVGENTSRPANVRTGRLGPPPKPSEAGSVGRGGARKRTQFSPSGGNEGKRTLRRRSALPQAVIRRGWGFVPGERLSKYFSTVSIPLLPAAGGGYFCRYDRGVPPIWRQSAAISLRRGTNSARAMTKLPAQWARSQGMPLIHQLTMAPHPPVNR